MAEELNQQTQTAAPQAAPADTNVPPQAAQPQQQGFHDGLAKVSSDILGYINAELVRHQEILNIVNAIKLNVLTLEKQLLNARAQKTLWQKIKGIFVK